MKKPKWQISYEEQVVKFDNLLLLDEIIKQASYAGSDHYDGRNDIMLEFCEKELKDRIMKWKAKCGNT